MLQARGFAEGKVNFLAPHWHSYNKAFDASEDELAGYWEWTYFPLEPDDEY